MWASLERNDRLQAEKFETHHAGFLTPVKYMKPLRFAS